MPYRLHRTALRCALLLSPPASSLLAQEPFFAPYLKQGVYWKSAASTHATNKAEDSYTYKRFTYWAHSDRPELNDAFAAELQRQLPAGVKLEVVTGEQEVETLYKKDPGAHVFYIDVYDTELGSGSTYTITKSIHFRMYDESGPCENLVLDHLMCHPAEIIAAVAVRNILWRHQQMGAFMDQPHKDHFEDSKRDYYGTMATIRSQKLYIADAHLNADIADIRKVYPGELEVVTLEELYRMLRERSDALVCIAMSDDCRTSIKGEALTNQRGIINARTGACLVGASSIPGSGSNKYGFYKEDFIGLAKVK
jgi:hypothetical protein